MKAKQKSLSIDNEKYLLLNQIWTKRKKIDEDYKKASNLKSKSNLFETTFDNYQSNVRFDLLWKLVIPERKQIKICI